MRSSRLLRYPSELRARWRSALARWARKRQGEDRLALTLHSRRIYILPTRAGMAAGALLFMMLLAGLNYNNSLALLLCFVLTGVVLVSMHECHRMLSGLSVVRAQVDSTFAGRRGRIELQFENPHARRRSGLSVRCAPCEAAEFALAPGASQLVRVAYEGGRRGRQRIERLELSSNAPLGLFRAWSWLHLPLEAIIYPHPEGGLAVPPGGAESRADVQRARVTGEEEWAWLRPFQDSDPLRSVAWKNYARGGPLMVAHYDASASRHRRLDYSTLTALAPERRLSQLAQWVLDCERLGDSYALLLPDATLPARHGLAQRRACLEALALFGL